MQSVMKPQCWSSDSPCGFQLASSHRLRGARFRISSRPMHAPSGIAFTAAEAAPVADLLFDVLQPLPVALPVLACVGSAAVMQARA